MCHERLFILDEISNRYTPSPKLSQKVSPPVSCRREGLVVCLSLFRTLSREIKNASQSPSDASAVFDSMYAFRILKAWNRPMPAAGGQDVTGQHQRPGAPLQKVQKGESVPPDPPASSNAPPRRQKRPFNPPQQVLPGNKLQRSSQMLNPVVPFARPAPASARQSPCPNCLRIGTKVFHSLSVCQFLGNSCRIPCGAKKSDNSVCDGIHWRAACPHNKVMQA